MCSHVRRFLTSELVYWTEARMRESGEVFRVAKIHKDTNQRKKKGRERK